MKRNGLLTYGLTVLTASTALIDAGGTARAADKKPNILVIWGDPPRQKADTLSIKKALENAMEKMQTPNGSSN